MRLQIILRDKHLHCIYSTSWQGSIFIEEVVGKARASQATGETAQCRAVKIIDWELVCFEEQAAHVPCRANDAVKRTPTVNRISCNERKCWQYLLCSLDSADGNGYVWVSAGSDYVVRRACDTSSRRAVELQGGVSGSYNDGTCLQLVYLLDHLTPGLLLDSRVDVGWWRLKTVPQLLNL